MSMCPTRRVRYISSNLGAGVVQLLYEGRPIPHVRAGIGRAVCVALYRAPVFFFIVILWFLAATSTTW